MDCGLWICCLLPAACCLLPADLRRLLIDGGIGLGLVVVLVVVFALDRHSVGDTDKRATEVLKNVKVAPPSLPVQALRLAVTPPVYDDMGKLLDTLGAGYRHEMISYADLLEEDRLAEYDVVFLTCGLVPRKWLARSLRAGQRDGGVAGYAKQRIRQRLYDSLRGFVAAGGTLYVSDWQFQLLAIAFPEFVDHSKADRGAVQTVDAEVLDRALAQRLGSKIQLRFDKPAWYPAALEGNELVTYLRGTYSTTEGRQLTAPLLVKFPFERGTVIFTSFHNEAQNSDVETELLRYLVFASVTAELQASVKHTMIEGGFSPTERNLLSASAGDQSVSRTYQCRRAGGLQFVLGFAARGARLRLSVAAPDGRRWEKTGSSTFTVDVPDATPGEWKYTITPIEVPYENFPFTLTVGEED